MKHLHTLLLALPVLSLASCVMPPPVYTSQPMPPPSSQDLAIRRANVNAIEDESFAFRQRERIGQAQAVELATRNAPRSITNTSTNVIIDN